LADWNDSGLGIDQRARAYLDINCGHCHNPAGPADTSGLFLDIDTLDLRRLGVCKPPVAAGRGSGDLFVAIEPGKPEESIMAYRMASIDPGEAMPELGRSTVHREGVELIRQWIAALEPGCEG
jgi:mono/diheme cytochrome c family protein